MNVNRNTNVDQEFGHWNVRVVCSLLISLMSISFSPSTLNVPNETKRNESYEALWLRFFRISLPLLYVWYGVLWYAMNKPTSVNVAVARLPPKINGIPYDGFCFVWGHKNTTANGTNEHEFTPKWTTKISQAFMGLWQPSEFLSIFAKFDELTFQNKFRNNSVSHVFRCHLNCRIMLNHCCDEREFATIFKSLNRFEWNQNAIVK